MKPEQIDKIVREAAVKSIVDAVEQAAEKSPWITQMRIRIEHAQIIRDLDIPRIARLGICIAVQPTGLSQPNRDLAMFGTSRFRRLYPFRSLWNGFPMHACSLQ